MMKRRITVLFCLLASLCAFTFSHLPAAQSPECPAEIRELLNRAKASLVKFREEVGDSEEWIKKHHPIQYIRLAMPRRWLLGVEVERHLGQIGLLSVDIRNLIVAIVRFIESSKSTEKALTDFQVELILKVMDRLHRLPAKIERKYSTSPTDLTEPTVRYWSVTVTEREQRILKLLTKCFESLEFMASEAKVNRLISDLF